MSASPQVNLNGHGVSHIRPMAYLAEQIPHPPGRFAEQQFLLNALPDAVVLVDSHGMIVRVNSAAVRAFGYAEDALLGQAIEILIPESLRRGHVQLRNKYFAAPIGRPMGSNIVLSARRRNGEEFPVEVSLNPIVDGGQLFIVCAIRDRTERQQREVRLRDAEARY